MKTYCAMSLLAGMVCYSAQATLYENDFNNSGAIPQGGGTLSFEQTLSGIPDLPITSVDLVLTFNSTASLDGGILGLLNWGTEVSSPYVEFTPASYTMASGSAIYTVTFDGAYGTPGTGFDTLNPNQTWGLVLWDASTSGIQNGLVSWSLDITAVPEPTTWAGIIFAGGLVVFYGGRNHAVRGRIRRWRDAMDRWLDAA